MKNKKGFTLIELLAVIVILAIIALIATPIVMNVIENSRKGAAERSAENYLRAVETAVAAERINGPVEDGQYSVMADGNLCKGTIDGTGCTGIKISVEVSGNIPATNSVVVIVNGMVDKTQVTIIIGDYTVNDEDRDGKLEASKEEEETENSPRVVYRWSTESINLEQQIDPTDTTKFTTDPTTLGKNLYLKHVVENNIVKESYVCAIFNNEESCLRGGSADYFGYADDPANYTGNTLILKKLQDKGHEDLSCNLWSISVGCDDGFSYLNASDSGSVSTNVGSDCCYVNTDGSSYCETF